MIPSLVVISDIIEGKLSNFSEELILILRAFVNNHAAELVFNKIININHWVGKILEYF